MNARLFSGRSVRCDYTPTPLFDKTNVARVRPTPPKLWYRVPRGGNGMKVAGAATCPTVIL